MSKTGGVVRRNSVNEVFAVLAAIVAAALVILGPAEPLDDDAAGVALLGLGTFVTVWAAASAAWWALAVAAAVATASAFDPLLAAAGAATFVGALVIGLRQRDQSLARSVVAGAVVNVLARSELEVVQGLSATIAVVTCLLLFLNGVSRRPSRIRRPARIGAVVVGAAILIGLGMTAAAAAVARPDISDGVDDAQQGIAAVEDGDYAAGAEYFGRAADSFQRVGDLLGGPVALPGRVVPGIAQNVSAGADLAAVAADAALQAEAALVQLDRIDLGFRNGAIDVAAVASIEEPLLTVQGAIGDLESAIDDVRSPWLAGPLQTELDGLQADFDDANEQLDTALTAVRLAPQMLGADSPRRYLLMFGTPSEARGLGGFVGSYAEVRVDDGHITVPRFARRAAVQAQANRSGADCADCPAEVLAGYGQFLTNADAVVDTAAWQNITMPAHFPHVARTAQVLYPQSGGKQIDGALVIDPYVVGALMRYTGPVEVPEFGVTVRPGEAARFIIEDQYVLAGDDGNNQRRDAMQALGEEVITRLLTTSLPEPADLARDLAPLVDERRLLFWTDVPEEQGFLATAGLLGELPQLGDEDGGFSVSVNNSSGNKIEIFLSRDVDARVVTGDDGSRRLVVDATLTNNAPRQGYPRYVIGNGFGARNGTSRALVTMYGPPGLEVATLDGEPFEYGVFSEAGWTAYRHSITLPSRQSAVYRLEWPLPPAEVDMDGADEPADSAPTPAGWEQPLVKPEPPPEAAEADAAG